MRYKECSLRCRIAVAPSCATDYLPDDLLIKFTAADALHHGKVLEIVVSLEQGVSSKELDQDAANTPNIAGEAPSKVQDNLGRSVMSC